LFGVDSFVVVQRNQTSIKRRIEEIGVPLKDWDISIYRGILTGLNEAFIINGEKKNELIAKDSRNTEILKPILRGRDIKRYKAEFADLWLVASHNGYRDLDGKEIQSINLKKYYPVIYQYLDNIGKAIQRGEIKVKGKGLYDRDDQGTHWSNLRDCAYYPEFRKEKILYAEIVYDSAFHYETKTFCPEATTFIMTGERLKYLTAMLNSKLLTYAFKKFYAGGDLRGNTFRYKKVFLELLPVPKLSDETQFHFERLVDCILFCKWCDMESESSHFESIIDALVYELYFSDEIKAAEAEVLKHLTGLPELKEDWIDKKKLETIEKIYQELSDGKHPVSIAMARQKTIPEIRIIEGLDK
jgi:hypothetical protein